MSEIFLAKVEDRFAITSRGVAISPTFLTSDYTFNLTERLKIVTPDGRCLERDADVDIPRVWPPPKPEDFRYLILVRGVEKDDLPVGREIWIMNRNAEPGASPNVGPATPLGDSGVTEGPPSVS